MSSRDALHIPMKERSVGGPFATRLPRNLETSVGLQAALVEPASAHHHVAEPFRHSARSITLAVMMTDRCCNGCTCNTPYCLMTSSPFCFDDDYSLLLCKLCDCRLDNRIIYMYMSKGFCTEECRNEYYFLEYRYRLTMAMEAKDRRTRSEARKAQVVEGETAIGYRRIFFTCADVESFP